MIRLSLPIHIVIPIAILIVLCGGTALSAADTLKTRIDVSTVDQYDDWGPGEMGYNADDWSGLPACDSLEDTSECVSSPSTPAKASSPAPDNCIYYDHTYDADVYLSWGCG